MFVFWLIIAVLLIVLEVALGFTIVLLFAGLAAFTVSIVMYFDGIGSSEVVSQFAVFFLATFLWAIVLWKPFKKLIKDMAHNPDQYKNIVGQDAVVADEKIVRGRGGTVSWSGTLVNALIDESSKRDEMLKDDIVVITEVRDNIFIIKEKK